MSNPLAEANQKLLEMRAQLQGAQLFDASSLTHVPCSPAMPSPPSSAVSWEMCNAMAQVARLRAANGIQLLAQQKTAVSSGQVTKLDETAVSTQVADQPKKTVKTAVSTPLPVDRIGEVKVWPQLAFALKKAGYAPHYRLYVVARYLDPAGSGCTNINDIRINYTNKNSGNGRYLFTGRRLRQLLNEGDGLLWNWDRKTNNIYLRSVASMAKTGVLKLKHVGQAVMVPAAVLFAGQGEFNAHMHAAWLSACSDEAKPISQAAVKNATAVSERSQRRYNHVAGVQRQKNLEIGVKHTEITEEETSWRYGHNSFEFVDYHGRIGQPNGRYRARVMPNSYKRRYALAGNGRRRKINQELKRLVTNAETRGCSGSEWLIKRYHTNGSAAAQAFSRHPDHPAYWPSSAVGRCRMWFLL